MFGSEQIGVSQTYETPDVPARMNGLWVDSHTHTDLL